MDQERGLCTGSVTGSTNHMRETKEIIQAWKAGREQGAKMVLATVVHIEGSAYRAPGARMLVKEDGSVAGAVSGGCLEGDILRKALLVMTREKPLLLTYDTTEDEDAASVGVSLGCNGIIRILLEPVGTGDHDPVALLEKAIAIRQPAVLAVFFTPDESRNERQGTFLLADAGIHLLSATETPLPLQRLLPDLHQVFASQTPAFIAYQAGSNTSQAYTVFFEYIYPEIHLVIAGAGNDVLPVVQMAALLGWPVTLVDGRPAYASQARFPSCQIKLAGTANPLKDISIDHQTAILLMTHNFQYDKAVLKQALQANAAYIGILGPATKRNRLLQELTNEGVLISTAQEANIYGPTGLDIGAETPEEIAVSITAEIKAVFAQRPGSFLRSQAGSIHKRRTGVTLPLETYGIILLAAGQSKRLGTPKQELLYHGDTLLRNAARSALELKAGATLVVTGNNTEALKEQLKDMEVQIVANTHFTEGMASSIRTGIHHLTASYPHLQHILIMVCDQPYVNTTHLRRLIHRQQTTGAAVTASYYEGRKGVPALFNHVLFHELMALTGDTGAKHIIESMGDAVALVDFPEGAADVDDMFSYQQLIREDSITSS